MAGRVRGNLAWEKGEPMKKTIVGLWIALLLCGATAHGKCGVERWSVKTLADRDSAQVQFVPIITTIHDLRLFPAPSEKEIKLRNDSRFPQEKRVYQVNALLVGYKLESDEDFHVVIADPDHPTETMIVELPSPGCAPDLEHKYTLSAMRAELQKRYGKATKKFRRLAKPAPILVRGVFFFDFLHGQTGVAPNGGEIHPVISFYFNRK